MYGRAGDAMKLEPIVVRQTMMSGVWRRFAVHVFEGKVTVEDMASMEAAGVAWLKKNPGKLVELVIIFPSETRMTAEERSRMARVIKRWENIRAASATVILAEGLLGAMHRSVLTGLQFLAPAPHPTRVFGKTADSLSWLLPYIGELCGADSSQEELLAAIEEHCRTFRSRSLPVGIPV
jgi:hypothetical protein